MVMKKDLEERDFCSLEEDVSVEDDDTISEGDLSERSSHGHQCNELLTQE